MSGLTREELTPCAHCGKGLGHVNGLFFYRLTIQRMHIDHKAVREQVGLEHIVGSPAIAAALAPDNQLAKPVSEGTQVLLCDNCVMGNLIIAALEEMAYEARKDREREAEPGRYDGLIDLDDRRGEVPGA